MAAFSWLSMVAPCPCGEMVYGGGESGVSYGRTLPVRGDAVDRPIA
jgi:hypothetical protein